jgi:transposase
MKNQHYTIKKETLQTLRGNSQRERILHRMHSVVLVLSGLTAVQVAKIYGDSSRAVAYWVEHFKQHGASGLEEAVRPGRPSKLSVSQFKKLQSFVRRSREKPERVNAKTLSLYLLREFEITLTPRQCWRILKRLEL